MLSKNSNLMWEASSEILRCNETKYLQKLHPHIADMQHAIQNTKMGGMVVSHKSTIELAVQYIKNRCNGVCRCCLYQQESFISPNSEKQMGYLRIKESKIIHHLHEEHFLILCYGCGMEFNVVEIIGGHVPRYCWTSVV